MARFKITADENKRIAEKSDTRSGRRFDSVVFVLTQK